MRIFLILFCIFFVTSCKPPGLNNNDKGFISTNESAVLIDKDNNKIFLDNFSYNIKDYIFKSVGYVKIEDKDGKQKAKVEQNKSIQKIGRKKKR